MGVDIPSEHLDRNGSSGSFRYLHFKGILLKSKPSFFICRRKCQRWFRQKQYLRKVILHYYISKEKRHFRDGNGGKTGNFFISDQERDIERRLVTREIVFCIAWNEYTTNEKWIYYGKPNRGKSWVMLKVILCIWWDKRAVIYYELLKPSELITDSSEYFWIEI